MPLYPTPRPPATIASVTQTPATALQRLLKRLDVQRLDRDLFLGDAGRGEGRLFGGFVAAQSLVAASRTLEPAQGEVHSLHAYFIRPGQHHVPITYTVDRIRDGKSFATRRVAAHQAGEGIFCLDASYTPGEEGISHQEPMPEAPGPDGLLNWDLIRSDRNIDPESWGRWSPIEILACDPAAARSTERGPAHRQVWIRPRGEMPADPLMHAALITWASDRGLVSTAQRAHGIAWNRASSASLDHTIWFHRPARWDGWMLYTAWSNAANSGRALIHGTMYRQDGTLMASVAQEGLVRRARPS